MIFKPRSVHTHTHLHTFENFFLDNIYPRSLCGILGDLGGRFFLLKLFCSPQVTGPSALLKVAWVVATQIFLDFHPETLGKMNAI